MEPKDAHGPAGRRGPTSLALLQGVSIALGLGLIAAWSFGTPAMLELGPQLSTRVRGYGLWVLPLLALVLLINHTWMNPVITRWHRWLNGAPPAEPLEPLVLRTVRYPYHSFVVTLLGVVLAAGVVAVVQAARLPTPLFLIVELLLLAIAFAILFATLSLFVGALLVAPYLRAPGLYSSGPSWEPDLRLRLVLAAGCIATAAWLLLGAVAFDGQRLQVLRWLDAGTLHPAVRKLAIDLALGGPLFLVLSLGFSVFAARDLAQEPRAIAAALGKLASSAKPDLEEPLPVLSPDEFGEMTAAFNRLATHLVEHERSLQALAAEAREADDRQVEFLIGVSHGLRTPLHSILGFCQLLLEGAEGELSEAQIEDVRSIVKGAHHLLSLIDDLVDLSRIESGRLALNQRLFDPVRTIGEAVDAAGGLLRAPEVRLRTEFPPEVPEIWADETRLRQILFNLIGNAAKFTVQGEILVRLELLDPKHLVIAVLDSGPGIPFDALERVFGEFEQLRGGGRPDARGTGLGLAITRRLVELHGGRVWVENRAEGGAAFFVSLPRQPSEVTA